MSQQARMAAGNASVPEAGVSASSDAGAGPFVINLTSSTTPMALAHPDSPELKRFSFFVSRRREDNRERFRLHMGYFATLAEAEEWLNIIRDLYPGAWAGEAPGKKLRARTAAAELASQLSAPPPVSVAARAAGPHPAARTTAAAPIEIEVPTLQAAPPLPPAPQTAIAAPAPPPPVVTAPPPRAATRPAAAPVSVSAQPPAATAKAPVPPQKPQAAVATSAPAKGGKKNPANALTDGSNVREVMASLDETGETRQMRIPPGLRSPAPAAKSPAPVVASAPAAAPAARPSGGAAGRAPSAPAQNVAQSARGPAQAETPRAAVAPPPARVPAVDSQAAETMSDTQVLRMLEVRRSDEGDKGNEDANAGISLLKPDDTQTRRALKDAVIDNAPVSFAVQLQWSVQPVQLDKVPLLAIFSAYTLYTVEGSREGRKWYGLRLGFFSDAISAKQVAYYVRSEFTSVAVVPVSPAEKARASDEEAKAGTGAFRRKHVEPKIEEFKLFDDDKSAASDPPAKAAQPAKPVLRGTAARKNKPLGRVKAREQRSPKTLEETLEILGASELEIDNGRGETLNDTGVRHLRVEVQKNTPFAKLLDRISERVRKN